MSSPISDLHDMFLLFANDIRGVNCVYEDEETESENSKTRMMTLSDMSQSLQANAAASGSEQLDATTRQHLLRFLTAHNRLFSIVSEQRSIGISNAEFFKYYTKALAKKDGKPLEAGVSFNAAMWPVCASKPELVAKLDSVNIGKIVRKQIKLGLTTNVKKFHDYIYMLYLQVVQILYPEILSSKTATIPADTLKNYQAIEKCIEQSINASDDELSSDGEISPELTDGIKNMCNSMVDELIPDNNMKSIFKTMMENDHMNSVLGSLLNATCKPQDIKKLKSELKNTTEDDLKNVCNETRKTLDSLDMNLDNFGDPEKMKSMQAKMEERLKSMGGGGIDEAMKKMFGAQGMPDLSHMMDSMKAGSGSAAGGTAADNTFERMMEKTAETPIGKSVNGLMSSIQSSIDKMNAAEPAATAAATAATAAVDEDAILDDLLASTK